MSAPTFAVNVVAQITVVETINGAVVASNQTVTLNGFNENVQLTGTSMPAVTEGTGFVLTLSAGTATIDLTALPGLTPSETINGTGLKVQAIKFQNPSANGITVSQGGSNPYRTDAASNWSVPLAPGQSDTKYLNGAGDTVGSSHKNIDVVGTGSQTLNVIVVLG